MNNEQLHSPFKQLFVYGVSGKFCVIRRWLCGLEQRSP